MFAAYSLQIIRIRLIQKRRQENAKKCDKEFLISARQKKPKQSKAKQNKAKKPKQSQKSCISKNII